ncbi:uncharacterized protein MJAP1_000534 [Malassezia japonica]|uniref:Uncharacterized protein n=1 Tax=Malassezia japonica TaxID=223818 RepID=A0AAF0J8S9_9BASI|nr:uncharacterized protein MJAP1_000534 [Malassezia japonica]WFD37588.1 hypothetical protein MJAP1_000534 [Malassezia japonica]
MKTAAYVVRVPHAQHRAFAVQCTVLDHSLMVWAGAAPRSLGDEDDEEVRAAMQAAGRDESTHVPARLADDWGVAMNRGGSGNVRATTGTALYRANTSVAMAQRIAAKLGIPQVFLSLDLPDALLASGAVQMAPEDARALQALEVGLRRVCEMALRGEK